MTTKTEARHPGEFIISEDLASSRAYGIVAQGQSLAAGRLVARNAAREFVAWTEGACAGILLAGVDATLEARPGAVVARAARVHLESLSFGDADEDDAVSALSSIGIKSLSLTQSVTPPDEGGGELEWLPEGATAHADPVNEHYYADGAERVLSDVFSGVNARDASGITVDGVADNYPSGTALLRTTATPESGWSVVIEWDQASFGDAGQDQILYARNAGGSSAEVFMDGTSHGIFASASDGGFDAESDPVSLGLHKVGVTFDGSDFTFGSLDGGSFDVSSPGESPLGVITALRFGHTAGLGSFTLKGTFKTITFYAQLDQAGLNARTA